MSTRESSIQTDLTKILQPNDIFQQYRYRWFIIFLVAFAVLINGLGNNALIPITSKLSKVYQLSDTYTSSPIIISFLVYSIVNLPSNHITDTYGLRLGFIIGASLYTSGLAFMTLINYGYHFVLIGCILFSIGQPFILSCPAKVATFWFFSENRPFATAIITVCNIIGTGLGFILPALVVKQQYTGQTAKKAIMHLYLSQFILSIICLVLICLFMRAKPPKSPSLGAEKEKKPIIQSLKLIKRDWNLWCFYLAYMILYGTLVTFGSEANFLLKPYHYKDFQISLLAVCLILSGVFGSLVFTYYLKKTQRYFFIIKLIPFLSTCFVLVLTLLLNLYVPIFLIFIIVFFTGFCFTPLVPICYDLGCQLCFPMGQAQVTGILNGGAMVFTFFLSLINSSLIGFGSQFDTKLIMFIFICLMAYATFLFFLINIDLKRKKMQNQMKKQNIEDDRDDSERNTEEKSDKIEQMSVISSERQVDQKLYEKDDKCIEKIDNTMIKQQISNDKQN